MLKDVKVGDFIWTIQSGWIEVIGIDDETVYPIKTVGSVYTRKGLYSFDDKYPSAFINPPEYFNPEPKPCTFKKNQKVMVWYNNPKLAVRRYFSHIDKNVYYCYTNGGTKWSSGGETVEWDNCLSVKEYKQKMLDMKC